MAARGSYRMKLLDYHLLLANSAGFVVIGRWGRVTPMSLVLSSCQPTIPTGDPPGGRMPSYANKLFTGVFEVPKLFYVVERG